MSSTGLKRTRKPSRAQQEISESMDYIHEHDDLMIPTDEDNDENELAHISRQEKELARKKKKLLKQRSKFSYSNHILLSDL